MWTLKSSFVSMMLIKHCPLLTQNQKWLIIFSYILKGPFPTLMQHAPRPNFLYHEIPWSLKTFKNCLSHQPSWTYSQLFYGQYINRSSCYSFLKVFWILSSRIRRKIFSVTLGSQSSYSVKRVGKKDNLWIFSLSRGTWEFWMKKKYFPIEIGIFKEKCGKIPDCRTLSYLKTVCGSVRWKFS